MSDWFWVWLILVVIFSVAELIEGGGFVGPWAVGAMAAALLEALAVSIDWQWFAFIGLSSSIFIAWQRVVHPVERNAPHSPAADEAPDEPRP